MSFHLRYSWLIGCVLYSFSIGNAQSLGFLLPEGKDAIDIPFTYENNFIIINVEFNNTFPLKFLFDTGAEHTILMDRTLTDLLAINYERVLPIVGSDLQTVVNALLIRNIHLKVGKLVAPTQDMLVLEEDIFRFPEYVGVDIHGILGADMFRRHTVEINYKKQVITIHRSEAFKLPKKSGYQSIDLTIYKNKPYFNTSVQLLNGRTLETKLLIDTGASITLMLNTYSSPDLQLPENIIRSNIGAGLGGFVEGFLGRITSIDIGNVTFPQIVTYFQDVNNFEGAPHLFGRNGLVGNVILNRFSVIIDYSKEKLYLAPIRKKLRKPFKYDKSGMSVIAAGAHQEQYIIQSVHPNSPAQEVGLQKGDKIVRINGFPSGFLTLATINSIFRRKAGKKIQLVIRRHGEKIKKTFYLRELI